MRKKQNFIMYVQSKYQKIFVFLIILFTVGFTIGCSGKISIGTGMEELSVNMGKDIKAIHQSYSSLVKEHFKHLRKQVNNFMQNQWIPIFIEDFIQRSDLIKMTQGTTTNEISENISQWVEIVLEMIEKKRNTLIAPLDGDEQKLLKMVDNAFSRLIWVNSKITSHLAKGKSVAPHKESEEDNASKPLDIQELHRKIEGGLAAASQRAGGAINQDKKAGIPPKELKQQEIKKEKENESVK